MLREPLPHSPHPSGMLAAPPVLSLDGHQAACRLNVKGHQQSGTNRFSLEGPQDRLHVVLLREDILLGC